MIANDLPKYLAAVLHKNHCLQNIFDMKFDTWNLFL